MYTNFNEVAIIAHKKAIMKWGSRILTLAAVGFVGFQLFQYEFDFSMLSSPFVVIGLLLIGIAIGFGVFFFSFNFHWLTQKLSGVLIDRKMTTKIYCATNMYKYLPINIMQYVGRNQIVAEAKGVSHAHVALATLLENVFRCLAAVLVVALLGVNLINYVQLTIPPWAIWVGLTIAASVVIAVMIIFRKRVTAGTMAVLLGNSVLRTLVISFTFMLALLLLGQSLTLELAIRVIGLYALAWLAGTLVPIVPGGIGVREAAILLLMDSVITEPILAATIVIHRVLYTIGDIFAWLFSMHYKPKFQPQ